ncbi:MAG: GMC family oxidoreductase [Candidatus Eisenbacteria bacterium]
MGTFDAIIVGSGFGGTMAAHELVNAGLRVLMLERGAWVTRGLHNWGPRGSVDLTPHYSLESPYRVENGGPPRTIGGYACVGGPSVFFGGVTLRLREPDFEPAPEIVGDSGAAWPIRYPDLEPYYARAERLLGVAGEVGEDPTEPPRSAPYPYPAAPLTETPRLLEQVGRGMGMHPYRLPLAINHEAGTRAACIGCTSCDTFACAISAKNDLATCLLPDLIARGLVLRPETVAVRLVIRGRRVTGIECVDRSGGGRTTWEAPRILLAAGALASPHLLMASDLPGLNPAGEMIGRHLVRHANGMTFAYLHDLPDRGRRFHKQLGFNDYYFGDPGAREVRGKLGSIQQLQAPPPALVRRNVPLPLKPVAGLVALTFPRVTGLLAMAEDQPRPENRVTIDRRHSDRFGLPQLVIRHRHTERDQAACRALLRRTRSLLHAAGGRVFYTYHIQTFSHAAGTVRFGRDPRSAPLDPWCRFRGVENLFVVDASFMPTGGGVNPSLTIAANALRVGEAIARDRLPPTEERACRTPHRDHSTSRSSAVASPRS